MRKPRKPCRDVACNVSTGRDITGVCMPDLVLLITCYSLLITHYSLLITY
ncbi:MAG: hypothetical protein F6K47_24855 [Symploca sp. SIO2E6]|nr:hypothetical protein [Symploca sp. SIO2E6]